MIDNPVKPFLEGRRTEIDEQSNRKLHQSQVGQNLFAMHRSQVPVSQQI